MPKLKQQFLLSSGYKLGYDEYGPAVGKPLFYFHGSPSSRLEFKLFVDEAMLQSLNVRVIAVGRPGMGLSPAGYSHACPALARGAGPKHPYGNGSLRGDGHPEL